MLGKRKQYRFQDELRSYKIDAKYGVTKDGVQQITCLSILRNKIN